MYTRPGRVEAGNKTFTEDTVRLSGFLKLYVR